MGEQTVRFTRDTTRWLGIWLNSAPTLQDNRRRCINLARQVKARLQRIVNKFGVSPAAAKNLHIAPVQGAMLYASELTWNYRRGMEGECQADG